MDPLPIGSAGALAAGSVLAWAVRGRSSAVFGPSLWRGNPVRPAIALTFDDGPSESTPQLLEILARHKVPATFRSEERRVGKEGRSRWSPYHYKKEPPGTA